MKESLLTQLKRSLSNRSRRGKESQQRPDTPNTLKYLDVDGDARSTYSVESDSKSFFSFSFENADSKSLRDFEITSYEGTKSIRKFSFEKGAEGEYPPPPYNVDRLEWILFYPEGVGRMFVGMLGINDIVAMSQVCRVWRRWLVPNREPVNGVLERIENYPWNLAVFQPSTKNRPRWHPLVQTVIAETPSLQKRIDVIEPLGFYGRYHRQSILHSQKYEFSIPRLIKVFGAEYLSAITSLHLDGTMLETRSNWLRYCVNLESLSIRRCAGITLDRLVDLILGPEDESHGGSAKKKKQKAAVDGPRPEHLRSVGFWGIEGARQLAYSHNTDHYSPDRQKLEKLCNRLMDRYETDVSWCFDGRDLYQKYILLISMVEACGFCGAARTNLGWREDGITCERCLGYVCKRCLKMESWKKGDTFKDDDISNPSAVNMLELSCPRGSICGLPHHLHPECIPATNLLWPNDPLDHVHEFYGSRE